MINTPAVAPGRMLQNMRSALLRGWPEVKGCRRHDLTLSVAGGGPSLSDTCRQMTGIIAAINGSQKYLTERGILPNICGILDPGAHMPSVIVADRRVRYYVASICDPAVFDKLKDCDVRLWHPTSVTGGQGLLELRGGDWLQIGGGSTMGITWVSLGYVLGFRKFHLHGLDSSFRDGETHAYADRNRNGEILTVDGRKTRANFLEQVGDFFDMVTKFDRLTKSGQTEPIDIEVFGDGLLQDRWKAYQLRVAA